MRKRLFLPALLLAAACSDAPDGSGTSGDAQKAPPPEPTAGVTGITEIQAGHDSIREEIAKLEAKLAAGEKPPQWLVKNQLKLVDNLLTAAEMAIHLDARKSLRMSLGQMKRTDSKLRLAKDRELAEAREIQELLDGANSGTDQIPPGFTAAELKDRMADHVEAARRIQGEIDELTERIREEGMGLSAEKVEPKSENIFTRELEDLKETRKRVEKLLAGG